MSSQFISKKSKNNVFLLDLMRNAIQTRDIKRIEHLIDCGVDIKGYQFLCLACHYGYTDIVNLFLEKGVYIDIRNREGMTPLSIAISKGYVELIILLLEKGANVNGLYSNMTNSGDRYIHIAANCEDVYIIELFLEKGANVDEQNSVGNTPFIIASSKGFTGIVKLLLKKGANINHKNKFGDTSLHLVSKYGRYKMIERLLEYGIDYNIKNNKNQDGLWVFEEQEKNRLIMEFSSTVLDIKEPGED